ncbi:MAG: hypothetical protein IIB82_06475 [Bacteroidetes bacterium]|nr:hypothetical protein [Bacteroidota bacterium]
MKELPNQGEIVFFDRSWYNRAVVDPGNNLCSKQQYDLFMYQVAEFEDMLHEDGIKITKFWLSIKKMNKKTPGICKRRSACLLETKWAG